MPCYQVKILREAASAAAAAELPRTDLASAAAFRSLARDLRSWSTDILAHEPDDGDGVSLGHLSSNESTP